MEIECILSGFGIRGYSYYKDKWNLEKHKKKIPLLCQTRRTEAGEPLGIFLQSTSSQSTLVGHMPSELTNQDYNIFLKRFLKNNFQGQTEIVAMVTENIPRKGERGLEVPCEFYLRGKDTPEIRTFLENVRTEVNKLGKQRASISCSKIKKIGKQSKRTLAAGDTESKQKRPLSAYQLFVRDKSAEITSQNPRLLFGERSKILSKMWQEINPSLKEVYERKAKNLSGNVKDTKGGPKRRSNQCEKTKPKKTKGGPKRCSNQCEKTKPKKVPRTEKNGTARGEGLDVPDSWQSSGSSSRGCGQPFKKKVDDTLCQSMVSTLNELMKSVGVLVSHGNIMGTVFRVGTKYVMTALHVMRGIVDPNGSGDVDLTHLENTNTFINFNESPVTPAKQPYYLKKEIICNEKLDVAVLEISNPLNLPMKMNLHKPRPFETEVANVALIGFGHTGHEKKCLESKCEVIPVSSERMKSALEFLQQNRGRYRDAMQQTNKNPDVVDRGYTGYDDPSKLMFDCFMEHGASGAPALTNNNERSVEVVAMLTHGLPEFYFTLPQITKALFPNKYRVELGTKMISIYNWIKALENEVLLKDMFY